MKKGMIIHLLVWVLIFLVIIQLSKAITINEIMYNPEGSDNNKEFIELFFDNPSDEKNLSGFIIADLDSSDPLTLIYYSESDYALIVEEGFDFSRVNASVYSVGTTIGNNLNNDYDEITIKDPSENILTSVNYDNTFADNNCKSLERVGVAWLESLECGGTPGFINSAISFDNETTNQTQNQTNNSSNTTECLHDFSTTTNKELYDDGEKVKIILDINTSDASDPFLIEYWVEDLNGKIAKKRTTTSNTNQKSWTPRISEQDQSFYVKGIALVNCSESNSSIIEMKIESKTLITVKGKPLSTESSITIEEIYTGRDDSVNFGEILRTRVSVYKGDISKSTINVWIQEEEDINEDNIKISETSKLLVYDKFTHYEFTIPIQIKPNCDYEFDDGTYFLVLEGLNISSLLEVKVEDNKESLCPNSESSVPSTPSGKIIYKIHEFNEEIITGEQFTTSVMIENDNVQHDFEIWSYAYRGSKSYSGEREGNKKTIHLNAGDKEVIGLTTLVDDASPGMYKYKVKIRKDDQKTINEITREFTLLEPSEVIDSSTTNDSSGIHPEIAAALDINVEKKKNNSKASNEITGMATGELIYKSTSAKAKDLIIYFILLVFVLLLGLMYQSMREAKKEKRPLEAPITDSFKNPSRTPKKHGKGEIRRKKSKKKHKAER